MDPIGIAWLLHDVVLHGDAQWVPVPELVLSCMSVECAVCLWSVTSH